jgi:rubrerythrin
MSQQPPVKSKPTKEEREAEEEKLIDRIAEKVAAKLGKPETKTEYPYSACPNCGYLFISKEHEDRCPICPECGYEGKTVILHNDKTQK